MTTDSSWDPTRWRDGQQHEYHDDVQTPRASVHPAIDRNLQNSTLDSYARTWNSQPDIEVERQAQKLPPLTEPHADASNHQAWSQERHSPSPSGKYGFPKLTRLPEPASAWQSLRYDNDDRRNERRIAEAPLTLHIPNSQDLHRTPPGYTVASSDIHSSTSHSSWLQHTTSLPSFATLQEHAGRKNDLDDDDVASLSSPLPCHLCTKLVSKVKEVANAVVELDEEVQATCNNSMKRTSHYPAASPLSTVHWILDTLRSAKDELKALRGTTTGYGYQPAPTSLSVAPTRNMSPPSALKRSAERWDQEDLPVPKRPRSGPSAEEAFERRSTMATDHRRASIDFITGDHFQRPGLSPPASESVPGSAYPRASSPGRGNRTLPSPTSTAYPPSAAPSLPHQSAQITGSPTASSQHETSIGSGSATSAHIAELRHQVSLKSLALQTLESEYTSLLQKIQRLNIKTQTMERKSNVADQEVNELTTKNEDLNQQVQSLQDQLDESEKRREKERDDSGREKDQWLQMLDQGRRLQAKLEEDKRVLTQEITSLKSNVSRLQKERDIRFSNSWQGSTSGAEQNFRGPNQPDSEIRNMSAGSDEMTAGDVAALKAKVEILRRSLEEARRHNQVLDERANEIVQRSSHLGGLIDRALDDESSSTEKENLPVTDRGDGVKAGHSQLPRTKSRSPTEHMRSEQSSASDRPSVSIPGNQSVVKPARPVVPSPTERSLQGNPQMSSPEDLSRPSGRASVPSAASDYSNQHMTATREPRNEVNPFKSPRQGRQMPKGVNLWSTLSYGQPGEPNNPLPIGSFRPLNQDTMNMQSESKPVSSRTITSPQSGHASPDAVMDDASSSSTRSANGQSPASSWAGDGQYGADLTPVSTLPTPGSAVSLKQYPSYPFERQYSIENPGAMPPPPRPGVQSAELDSARG